jgi:DNA-directed RNA polymerases I, II, and III subunit RPABC2
MSSTEESFDEHEEQSFHEAEEDFLVENQSEALEEEAVTRFTSPILTKFERAKILGVRAQQISMSAPIMVEYGDETDSVEIARKELKEKKIPLIVLRRLPDNTYEKWAVRDLINFYD